jgi:hypothetical protein
MVRGDGEYKHIHSILFPPAPTSGWIRDPVVRARRNRYKRYAGRRIGAERLSDSMFLTKHHCCPETSG